MDKASDSSSSDCGSAEPCSAQHFLAEVERVFSSRFVVEAPLKGKAKIPVFSIVSSSEALEIFQLLRDDEAMLFNMLVDITAVDWMDRREPRFEIVYQLLSLTFQRRICIKVGVGEDDAQTPSVTSLWPAASFLEREVWDMFGVRFSGHPDLRRILMYDEFKGHPLRKDYPIRGKQPRVPLRMPELRNTAVDMHRDALVQISARKPGEQQTEKQS